MDSDYQSPSHFVEHLAPDFVVHTACSYGRNGESALEIFESNTHFGMQLLAGVIALDKPCTFINTGTVLDSDVSLYALSKNQFSELGRHIALTQKGRLRFVDVALQHMFGPGDSVSKFTTHVIQSCIRNEISLKLSAGTQKRDFIFIDDVVGAYATLINKASELPAFDCIELGSGTAPAVREFVEQVKKLTGATTELLFGEIPLRPGEQMLCVADTNKLKQLGWTPNYTLEQGLVATIEQERIK